MLLQEASPLSLASSPEPCVRRRRTTSSRAIFCRAKTAFSGELRLRFASVLVISSLPGRVLRACVCVSVEIDENAALWEGHILTRKRCFPEWQSSKGGESFNPTASPNLIPPLATQRAYHSTFLSLLMALL